MSTELRDKLAAEMNEESREIFLGTVEFIEAKTQEKLSERAKKAMQIPPLNLPPEVLEALVQYSDAKTKQ